MRDSGSTEASAHDTVSESQRAQNRRLLEKRLLQCGSAQPANRAEVCADNIECAIFERFGNSKLKYQYKDQVGRLCKDTKNTMVMDLLRGVMDGSITARYVAEASIDELAPLHIRLEREAHRKRSENSRILTTETAVYEKKTRSVLPADGVTETHARTHTCTGADSNRGEQVRQSVHHRTWRQLKHRRRVHAAAAEAARRLSRRRSLRYRAARSHPSR